MRWFHQILPKKEKRVSLTGNFAPSKNLGTTRNRWDLAHDKTFHLCPRVAVQAAAGAAAWGRIYTYTR